VLEGDADVCSSQELTVEISDLGGDVELVQRIHRKREAAAEFQLDLRFDLEPARQVFIERQYGIDAGAVVSASGLGHTDHDVRSQ
jgi:hypothetical protein